MWFPPPTAMLFGGSTWGLTHSKQVLYWLRFIFRYFQHCLLRQGFVMLLRLAWNLRPPVSASLSTGRLDYGTVLIWPCPLKKRTALGLHELTCQKHPSSVCFSRMGGRWKWWARRAAGPAAKGLRFCHSMLSFWWSVTLKPFNFMSISMLASILRPSKIMYRSLKVKEDIPSVEDKWHNLDLFTQIWLYTASEIHVV